MVLFFTVSYAATGQHKWMMMMIGRPQGERARRLVLIVYADVSLTCFDHCSSLWRPRSGSPIGCCYCRFPFRFVSSARFTVNRWATERMHLRKKQLGEFRSNHACLSVDVLSSQSSPVHLVLLFTVQSVLGWRKRAAF